VDRDEWGELYDRMEEMRHRLEPGQRLIAEHDPKTFRPVGLFVITIEDSTVVPLEDDLGMPARFRVDRDRVSLTISTEGGIPTVTLEVRDAPPRLLDRLGLSALFEQATTSVVVNLTERHRYPDWLTETHPDIAAEWDDEHGLLPAGSRASKTDAAPVVRRLYRTKITAADVERAADAYREGGVEAVQAALFVGERQAWRYVQRAQEQGLAERQRAPRRAKEETKK
jgi:hypothetical protein